MKYDHADFVEVLIESVNQEAVPQTDKSAQPTEAQVVDVLSFWDVDEAVEQEMIDRVVSLLSHAIQLKQIRRQSFTGMLQVHTLVVMILVLTSPLASLL